MGGAFDLYSDVTSELHEIIFTGNKAQWGGAIYNQLNVTLYIQESTFKSNHTQKDGGGICNALNVRARSHCAICDCDLFLLTMGCIGVGDVVTVA